MCLICLIRCRKRVTACCCWCVIPRNCVLRFLAHLFLLRRFSQFTDAFLSPILACFAQLSRKDFAELARQVPLRCFTRSQQLLRCGWWQSALVILNGYILDPDADLYRTRYFCCSLPLSSHQEYAYDTIEVATDVDDPCCGNRIVHSLAFKTSACAVSHCKTLPSHRYMSIIRQGARQVGLEEPYCSWLDRVPTQCS